MEQLGIVFTDEEIAEVLAEQPRLAKDDISTISGRYHLNAIFDAELLEADFDIKIISRDADTLPRLFETGGRTAEIVAKWDLPGPEELHQNISDGSACVCTLPAERQFHPKGAPLKNYVDRLALPYLYGLAYADENGKWPSWGEFSHGTPGLFEFYANQQNIDIDLDALKQVVVMMRRDSRWKEWHKQLRSPSIGRACPCGSKKPFGKCHPEAFEGVSVLEGKIREGGVNLKMLIDTAQK